MIQILTFFSSRGLWSFTRLLRDKEPFSQDSGRKRLSDRLDSNLRSKGKRRHGEIWVEPGVNVPRSSGSVNNWFILENPFYEATCSTAGTFREPIVVFVSCECVAYSIIPIWLPCVCELSAWSALEIIWHVIRIYFDLLS